LEKKKEEREREKGLDEKNIQGVCWCSMFLHAAGWMMALEVYLKEKDVIASFKTNLHKNIRKYSFVVFFCIFLLVFVQLLLC